MTGRPCACAKSMVLLWNDQFAVHLRRHERTVLEPHILEKPDSVRQPLAFEQYLPHADAHVGIGSAHIEHPLRIERHAHQVVFVPAKRVDRFEDVDAGPAEEAPLLPADPAGAPVALKIDAVRRRGQKRFGELLPAGAIRDAVADVFGRAVVRLVPPQGRAVAVEIRAGVFVLRDELVPFMRLHLEVEAPGEVDVEIEVFGCGNSRRHFPGFDPADRFSSSSLSPS